MAVSSTSWDCRPAQSTHSTLLCPTFWEQCRSTLQSGLCSVSGNYFMHLPLIDICCFFSYSPPSFPGRPSTSQVALTPTVGGLTLQLTAMYPGTREDTLQYSISTSASPRSRRQTGQQTLPVTDLTTPVSGSAEVALGPGIYSVTVTVTNQHGSTTSEPQQVTIPGWHVTALCHIQPCMCVHMCVCVGVCVC